ncbi:MAG: hypothetical protein C0432_04405 [Candidatus Puniceispirillum sp.]|nr:hypothetical protein [Candidatus Pelagibacter sp.]MBA4283517.1 hypothetical protein [Candidatus Puniceispirillum sp.]
MTLKIYLTPYLSNPLETETRTLFPCDLISCEIVQQEHQPAKAILKLYYERDMRPTHGCFQNKFVHIIYEKEEVEKLIFQGTLSKQLQLQNEGIVEYILISQPAEHYQILEDLKNQLSKDFSCIEEFTDTASLSHILETQARVLHWDRYGQNIQTSCIFQGTEFLTLDEDSIFENSLKVKHNPYSFQKIECCVEAQWTRKLNGFLNLSHFISQSTSSTFISTLTPQALIKKWPKVDCKITSSHNRSTPSSGYSIVKSELQKMDNLSLHLRKMTRDFDIKKGDQIEKLRFSYQWFKPIIRLQWTIEQKIHEHMTFHVQSFENLKDSPLIPINKKLIFRLQNPQHYLNDASDSTLFKNEKGKKLLDYAFKVASNHLKTAQRNIDVTFTCLWEQGINIHLDMSLTLKHPSFKKGYITGKIIEYKMCYEFECAYVWIKLGCVGTDQNVEEKKPPLWEWASENGTEESDLIHITDLNPHYFIESLSVSGDAFEQEDFLAQMVASNTLKLKEMCTVLKQKPTQLHVKLKPIDDIKNAFLNFKHINPIII